MCTYTITVNENTLARMNLEGSREDFSRWLQHHVDQFIEEMSDNATHRLPVTMTKAEALVLQQGSTIKALIPHIIPKRKSN